MAAAPQLDESSSVPAYRQIFQQFTKLIEDGKLAPGDRLPATRELAGQLGLNRNTVAAAYELLENAGWIASHVGRGTFVAARAVSPSTGLNWEAMLGVPVGRRPLSGTAEISFANSRPAEALFPVDEFRASCEEVLASPEIRQILQLGSPGGYEPLRQYLLDQSRQQCVAGDSDGLMIASGCQQALDLVRRLLVRPGDVVAIEDPVYPGTRNLFLESQAEIVGLPVNAGGLDIDEAARRIQRRRPRLLVLTPNFQNPTGATMPLDARRRILEIAHAAGTVVVENDSYGELRYRGNCLPTLKELDPHGDVVLLRSFSKISFPGLRVGWIVAPRVLISALTEAKHRSDLHSDQFSQAVLLDFARGGKLAAHRERMIRAGRERLQAVLQGCAAHLPAGSAWVEPEGGMNLWVRLPGNLDAEHLLTQAQRAGVAYLPGSYFQVEQDCRDCLRLSFAGRTPEEIDRGMKTLGEVFAAGWSDRRWSEREPAPALV